MKIYTKKEKNVLGWGFWGDYGEIDVGISSGYVGEKDELIPDKLHYHKKGTVYILTLEGKGIIEVDGEKIIMQKNEVLKIDPGEKYKHTKVTKKPLSWITFTTSKDPHDKVVIE